jgi:hypothetical protein
MLIHQQKLKCDLTNKNNDIILASLPDLITPNDQILLSNFDGLKNRFNSGVRAWNGAQIFDDQNKSVF